MNEARQGCILMYIQILIDYEEDVSVTVSKNSVILHKYLIQVSVRQEHVSTLLHAQYKTHSQT